MTRQISFGRALVAGILLLLIAGLLPGTARGDSPDRPNIILVVMDTVRRDALGCYGNRMGLTPQINRLADSSFVFERAYSHAPWTLPSIASLLTSRTPGKHGAAGALGEFTVLAEDQLTLPEHLQTQGYTTAAVTNVMFLGAKFGLDQGFGDLDVYEPEDNLTMRRAVPTTEAALAYLDQHATGAKTEGVSPAANPFFLLVHYFDPHLVYDPPQPFRARFADPRDATSNGYLFGTSDDLIAFRKRQKSIDRDTFGRLFRLYMGEINYVDHAIGQLMRGLADRGLRENTIIVITSDHGEEFGDHLGFEHGHTFYQELVQVPLIIHLPPSVAKKVEAAGQPLRIKAPIGQIDLAPTLCALVGARVPEPFDGQSLLPLCRGEKLRPQPILCQSNMWTLGGMAWIENGFKLIQNTYDGPFQLYNLRTDPKEREDLAEAQPKRVEAMLGKLGKVLVRLDHDRPQDLPDLDERDRERLRSLGYIR